jgi:hypothetical protein
MEAASSKRLSEATSILDSFATASGLSDARPPRRYLWTDAFAVMTWIGLHECTGQARFLDLAQRLVGQVHAVLGAHRSDPNHPTAQGLRIGKPLPERGVDEPFDEALEWQRDGQYYHYLTKWMHALQRTAGATLDERPRRWAVELAQAAHRAFAYPAGAPRRMYWKMSIDLSRPLVELMGAHDPLDGLVECATLGLERETRELARMCEGRRWWTDDPLGAGGLLLDALRLDRIVEGGRDSLRPLLACVHADAASSAEASARTIGGRASHRLAFRELGLALGLHAAAIFSEHVSAGPLKTLEPLATELEALWLEPRNQSQPSWTAHRDINAVMLAASLAPAGVIGPK